MAYSYEGIVHGFAAGVYQRAGRAENEKRGGQDGRPPAAGKTCHARPADALGPGAWAAISTTLQGHFARWVCAPTAPKTAISPMRGGYGDPPRTK